MKQCYVQLQRRQLFVIILLFEGGYYRTEEMSSRRRHRMAYKTGKFKIIFKTILITVSQFISH